MNRRMLGNALGAIALLCFIAAIIGMAIGGSHRWVEPIEELGWMFFTGCALVLLLMADSSGEARTVKSGWVNAAWACGSLAIALLLTAFIANVLSIHYRYWFEAIDTAGLVFMAATVVSAVLARGAGDS